MRWYAYKSSLKSSIRSIYYYSLNSAHCKHNFFSIFHPRHLYATSSNIKFLIYEQFKVWNKNLYTHMNHRTERQVNRSNITLIRYALFTNWAGEKRQEPTRKVIFLLFRSKNHIIWVLSGLVCVYYGRRVEGRARTRQNEVLAKSLKRVEKP